MSFQDEISGADRSGEPMTSKFEAVATAEQCGCRIPVALAEPECNQIRWIRLEGKIGQPSRFGDSALSVA